VLDSPTNTSVLGSPFVEFAIPFYVYSRSASAIMDADLTLCIASFGALPGMQDTEAAAMFKLARRTKTQVFNALVYMNTYNSSSFFGFDVTFEKVPRDTLRL
jgi:hypothetical protein